MVFIVGTHAQALKKLEQLRNKVHVFSTDNEEKGTLSTKNMIAKMKKNEMGNDMFSLKNIKKFDSLHDPDLANDGKKTQVFLDAHYYILDCFLTLIY